MPKTTEDLLLDYAEKFRQRFDTDSIEDKLRGRDPKDRREKVLFSTYHLLFSGAVAEANIKHYVEQTWEATPRRAVLPQPVETRADEEDRWANFMGWKGTAFDDTQNIIGALAFSVVVLFFFEGFCRVVLPVSKFTQGRGHLNDMLQWLKSDGKVSDPKVEAADFLRLYRNGWHNFGQYDGPKASCRGVTLTPGAPLPILAPPTRDELLADLLDLFLEVDSTY